MATHSLRDLLERLAGVVSGNAGQSHDTPVTLIDEIKDVLDHLACDELPGASCVFLSKDLPVGALRVLENAREQSKPPASVTAGRAKLFELVAHWLARIGTAASEPYAQDVKKECLRTFRTERGTSKTVKAASLVPLAVLFKLRALQANAPETIATAKELRVDFERHTANTQRVKANILSAIAAMHDGTGAGGRAGGDGKEEKVHPLSFEFQAQYEEFVSAQKKHTGAADEDTQSQTQNTEEEEAGLDVDFANDAPSDKGHEKEKERPTPTPSWLLRVGLLTADSKNNASSSATLVAEAFDAIGSALSALRRSARIFENANVNSFDSFAPTQTAVGPVDDAARRRIANATLAALALPSSGQRSDVTRAALRMVTEHCLSFISPPGMLTHAVEYFSALLLCRTSCNKNIRQAAAPALDAFLTSTASALADPTCAPEPERASIWCQLSKHALLLMDAKETSAKERTVAVRAVGKLAKAGAAVGGFACGSVHFDPDQMLHRVSRWTTSGESFVEGDNDFDRRYEAMERQIAVLGAYADLILARCSMSSSAESGNQVQVPNTALEQIAQVTRWCWEHYFVAGEKSREDLRFRLCELFDALVETGGAVTLAKVLSKIARPLLALTLRVAPPDPIDSAVFRAAPTPLWPRYVTLWTFICGGADSDGVSGFKGSRSLSLSSRSGKKLLADSQRSDVSSRSDGTEKETEESISPSSAAAEVAYRAFIREVLQLCQTLQLGVVPVRQNGLPVVENEPANENQSEDDTTQTALALELGQDLVAQNPGDMQTFLCLVDLCVQVLAGAPAHFIKPWLTTLIENVAALSAAHPLLSGFYKIARAALVAADDSGLFALSGTDGTGDGDAAAAKETCRAFLLDVLAGSQRLSDELRASALQLLLAAPAGLLTAFELAPALRAALAVGVQHPPLADAALEVLEQWTWKRQTFGDDEATDQNKNDSRHALSEISILLPSLVHSLRPYVNRAQHTNASSKETSRDDEDENGGGELDGAGAAYRAAKRARESARIADRFADFKADVDVRVARILGAVGGVAHVLVDDVDDDTFGVSARLKSSASASSSALTSSSTSALWDFEKRVSLDVEVGESCFVTIWLDQIIPHVSLVALSSTDRAAKVAAAEFLHAVTLLMVGRNARRWSPEAGDHAREATPFHKLYQKLFPVILELAIDAEPVTKTLFSALATQLIRWFTRNQAREAAETMALLDAIVEGLKWKDRRYLCAGLAAECLKWSVRSLGAEDLSAVRGGRGNASASASAANNVAVNVSSLLRRLFAFQTHPDPNRRLGAAVALRLCLNELRQFPDHAEAHALEILETSLRSLRLAERDPPGAGTAEAGALLARAATRACARHATALSRRHAGSGGDDASSTKNKNPARGGSFGTLPRLTSWIFATGTARVETRARLESQLAFSALVQRTPGYISPWAWVTTQRAKYSQNSAKSGDSAGTLTKPDDDFASLDGFWPFRVAGSLPTPEALMHDADTFSFSFGDAFAGDASSDVDVELTRVSARKNLDAGEQWMRALIGTLHWARWALERKLLTVEDLLSRRAVTGNEHPLNAAAYWIKVGVPAIDGEDVDGAKDGAGDANGALANGAMDHSLHHTRRPASSSPAARKWRKARVKLAVQVLVLAEAVARETSGVGAFFAALDSTASGENLSGDSQHASGVAHLACVASLAPETLGADIVGGRMDDVAQLAGAAARVLVPMMTVGETSNPDVAPVRLAARHTLRRMFAQHNGRFDLGAADVLSAEGLRAARRLAAGYRALANVNLLRPLLPSQSEEPNAAVVPTSRVNLARRLLLAAHGLGPDASPAQIEAGREWVTLAAHIGAAPEFVVQLVLGDVEVGGSLSGRRDANSHTICSKTPNRAAGSHQNAAAKFGEAFLQNFPKDVVAAVRWHFKSCVESLVQRVVDGSPGSTGALNLLFAVLELPTNGAATTIVETQILTALAVRAPEIASLVDRSTVHNSGTGHGLDHGEVREADDHKDDNGAAFRRHDERRRACVELVRRAIALDQACAGFGPGRGRVLFPAPTKPKPKSTDSTGSTETETGSNAPGDPLAIAVASVACPDTETFTGDDVGPAQREALDVFPQLLLAGGGAAAIAAAAAKRLARLLRDSGASRAASGSADGAAFAAARKGILTAAATPFPDHEAACAHSILAAVVAVVVDDADGGANAVAATLWRFERDCNSAVRENAGTEIPSGGVSTDDSSSKWPGKHLAEASWDIACDTNVDVDERVVAGSHVLPFLILGAPCEEAVGAFFGTRAAKLVELLDPQTADTELRSGVTSPGSVVATAHIAYATLSAMYTRCSKETVANGPGLSVDSFNAAVSRRAIGDLDGAGAVGVACKCASEATEALRRGRGFHADDVMELDRSDESDALDGKTDSEPAPELLPRASAVAARRAAFAAFAALVSTTQTKSKFYEKLLEGGAFRWNGLVCADAVVPLEVEIRVGRSVHKHGVRFGGTNPGNNANGDPVRGGNEPSDPSLAFTLSATLSANDSTLRTNSSGSQPGFSGNQPGFSARHGTSNTSNTAHPAHAAPDEGPVDELECDPIAESFFAALQRAASGNVFGVPSTETYVKENHGGSGKDKDRNTRHQTPRLFTLVADLAKDANVSPVVRMCVIKAVLRLHRREVAAADAAAEIEKAADLAAKAQLAALATKHPGPAAEDDEDEVFVVAEKSLEEIEQERLRKALEEGNYLDLTSLQVETITTDDPVAGADDTTTVNKIYVPPPRSTLSAHAFVMLPGLIRGVLDITKDANCTIVHSTLWELAVAALECESAWHKRTGDDVGVGKTTSETSSETTKETSQEIASALRELAAAVVSFSPSRNQFTLRQNIGLAVRLNLRLADCAARDAIASGASPAEVDKEAARALRPALDAAVDLIKGDESSQNKSKSYDATTKSKSRADSEQGRLARLCGVQIIGALANAGVLDLGGEAPVVRHVPCVTEGGEGGDLPGDEKKTKPKPSAPKTPGCAVTDGDAAFLCIGATTCLMEPGATSGRPLHAAAASLLGVALAQRAETVRLAAFLNNNDDDKDDAVDMDDDDDDDEPAFGKSKTPTEPKWCATLRKRLRFLYQKGPLDAFAIAVERIARREPGWLTGDDGAIIAQLHQLFPRLHGEPRFVAVSALARVAGVDAVQGASFAERALTSSVDGLDVLLSTKDAQVHALVMRALADALPGVAKENSRWPKGKKMDHNAWQRVATRAESALWNATDGDVKDAHVSFCAALADAAPLLAADPSVQSPLLRAVVDGRPNDLEGGRRQIALEFWRKHLPGTGGVANATLSKETVSKNSASAGNPFSRRLHAALQVLPMAPPGDGFVKNESAARSTASGWLASICDVVLSVPRSMPSWNNSLCDDDLARCEFRDAVVDVNWQGASLPMAPLFSTQSTHASMHSSFGSGTQHIGGSLQQTASLAGSWAGGVGVLATPVAFAGRDTFATQFGAATLTGFRGGGGGGGGVNTQNVELTATQAELPPWLRSSLGGGAGSGNAGMRDGMDGLVTTGKPMRRHLPGNTQNVSNTQNAFGEGGSGNASSVSTLASAAERRRRVERERALGRKRNVKLIRQYRSGELPDVRAASAAALLDPLAQLAKRDTQTASALLTALVDAALVAEETGNLGVGAKRKATTAETESTTRATSTTANSTNSSLRDGVRTAISALLPLASADDTLAAWALSAASKDPGFKFKAEHIRTAAFDGRCLASGVVALEARALVVQAERSSVRHAVATTTNKDNTSTITEDTETEALWNALAGLHRASGDDANARLCLARAFSFGEAFHGLEDEELLPRDNTYGDTQASVTKKTRAALTAQLEGDAKSARDIYNALLMEEPEPDSERDVSDVSGNKNHGQAHLRRLWFRERARCSQKLGEWHDLALDICDVVDPPWSVDTLRGGRVREESERAIPGAAFGGDALCAATRALARRCVYSSEHNVPDALLRAALDASLESILAHASAQPGAPLAEELGVEIATVRFGQGAEDVVVAHVSSIRACFRQRWLATPSAATFARRAALQPLQSATELEEVLFAVRLARAARDDPGAGVTALQDVVKRWAKRWPSDAKDPPEVWERVGFVRDAATRAFAQSAPPATAAAWLRSSASSASRRRSCESLVRAAKGMRRSGEVNGAYARLALAKSVLERKDPDSDAQVAPANDSWLVQKAVVKLRLAQAEAPGAFGVDGDRVSQEVTDTKRAKLLHGVLKNLVTLSATGSLHQHPESEAEAAMCVGALAARFANLPSKAQNFQNSSTQAQLGDVAELALVEFARGTTLATRRLQSLVTGSNKSLEYLNAARSAAKASLRLAAHCESLLCDWEERKTRGGADDDQKENVPKTFPPTSAVSDQTAHSAFHPGGVEATLVRHALLALAGGAGAKARHLVPRVLATLRETAEAETDQNESGDERSTNASAAASEFSRLAPRVPVWIFLEWLPQVLSLLDAPGHGGAAVVQTVQAIASKYPSAVYCDYKISRSEFSEIGASRCINSNLDTALTSRAGEQFARAVTLLDFPSQRLTWWRAHIKLLVAGVIATGGANEKTCETVFAAADAMVADVGDPDEQNLGALNRRFAQSARLGLVRAVGESRKKLNMALSKQKGTHVESLVSGLKFLVAQIVDAEKTILERWRSSQGSAATEARPRLAMAHFSRWFSAFEDTSANTAGNQSSQSIFANGVEIPGQYDSLCAPPDVLSHATLVGFEPETDVFASKQRPKKIVLRGSDGWGYSFIAKGSEDLRQDDRIERLFRAMDALLSNNPQARQRGLHVRTFHVLPLSKRAGLLQFVKNTVPLLEALGAKTKTGDLVGGKHQHWIKAQATFEEKDGEGVQVEKDDGEKDDSKSTPSKDQTKDQRILAKSTHSTLNTASRRRATPGVKLSAPAGATSATHFLEAMSRSPRVDARNALASLKRRAASASKPAASPSSPALRQTLLRVSGSHESYLEMRSKYAASVAAASICGYVAGVGDRHLQNILLDVATGSAVHIDFGYAFGTATAVLPIPELVPFRVTDCVLDGCAPGDTKVALKQDMARTMHALRDGAALLRGVMDCFLREPLLDWRREAAQSLVKAGKEASEDAVGVGQPKKEEYMHDQDDMDSDLHVVAGGSELEQRHVSQKIAIAFRKLRLGNPSLLTLAQCESKHGGRNHWLGLREMVLGTSSLGDDDIALQSTKTRRSVGDKRYCASVEEQIDCLMELATDPLVLATSWSGWRPWL